MKKVLLFVLLTLIVASVFSQRVEFEYNVSGNRVSRNVIVLRETRESLAQLQDSVVYTEKLKIFSVKIHPNPTDGLLMVELNNLSEEQEAVLSLYSVSGKPVFPRKKAEHFTEVDLTAQPQGMYVLRIEVSGNVSEWKIIKR